jgi:cell wall-associated NlpC family hydrolase
LRSSIAKLSKATAVAVVGGALFVASPAVAGTGGTPVPGTSSTTVHKAHMEGDRAVPAPDTPYRIKEVIWAGNRIRRKPYVWGGGHGSWEDNGYDCSGSVSYALHGGDFVSHPRTSGGFMSWGLHGKGRWITVYANGGHVWAVIAGLRWDTSQVPGSGPGWSTHMVSTSGYVARHYNSRF